MSNSMESTPERCRLLLTKWRENLNLNNHERSQLAGEIKVLDNQLHRFMVNKIRIAAFGRVGVGKSSLLNSLLSKKIFATDVAHGCTRKCKGARWEESIKPLQEVEFIDTPGIDEIASEGRARLASRVAMQADLVLLVIDSDLTALDKEALETLLKSGKQIFLILNRIDQWNSEELNELTTSIKNRLYKDAYKIKLQVAAAAPRELQVQLDGSIENKPCLPNVEELRNSLIHFLKTEGELLLTTNTLFQATNFYQLLKDGRLQRRKKAAQGLIGKFATLKASGVAVNPLLILDLAGGVACDTALIIQLSKLYDLKMGKSAAKQLLKKLSIYNALLGGAQLSIQFTLGMLKQVLVLSGPITGGLSLASAAPVALAQAALAVHTTKITGRLAAQELLKGSQRKEVHPHTILKRLAATDPKLKISMGSLRSTHSSTQLQSLLP